MEELKSAETGITSSRPVAEEARAKLIEQGEAVGLARQMSQQYLSSVCWYQHHMKMELPEAMKAAEKLRQPYEGQEHSILDTPSDQVSWHTLEEITLELGEEAAKQKWEQLKEQARAELFSGMRGARAVEGWGRNMPEDHARYIILLQELEDGWNPTNGIERRLIEQMAQASTLMEYWTEILAGRSNKNAKDFRAESDYHMMRNGRNGNGGWELPRVSEAQATAEAASMVDRFQRMFMRALRQLRDLRRYSQVVIHNPGQVNVGQQQINVSKSE